MYIHSPAQIIVIIIINIRRRTRSHYNTSNFLGSVGKTTIETFMRLTDLTWMETDTSKEEGSWLDALEQGTIN